MSRKNVELVREGYDALRRGDLEAAFAILAEDVRWEGVEGVEPCRSRDEVEDVMRSNVERGFELEAEEFIEAGDSVVVALRARRGTIGPEEPEPYRGHERVFNVLTLAGGKVVRLQDFLRRDDALAAAGGRS